LNIYSINFVSEMPKVAFLISEPDIGGGFNVIFRQAMELVRRGMNVAFISSAPVLPRHVDWHPIREIYTDPRFTWLDYNQASDHHFDLAIATWWATFFNLWKVKSERYAYFVQSIESRFYPLQDRVLRAAVDATYEASLGFVTEAKWIRDYLNRMHGHAAELAMNGIDKSIYRTDGELAAPRGGGMRVLVEGPVEVEFKNVPASIRLAREGGADEVWLLTASDIERAPGVDRVFSRIPQERTAPIYRACDVLLKLSTVEGMFGPPLEMFHCGGTSIVYDVTGHDEYIVHGRNALVARKHDEAAVRGYVRRLKETPEFLQGLKAGALKTAQSWPDWAESGRQFELAVNELIGRPSIGRSDLATYSRRIWDMVQGNCIEKAQLEFRLTDEKARLEARLTADKRELETRLSAEKARLEARLTADKMELESRLSAEKAEFESRLLARSRNKPFGMRAAPHAQFKPGRIMRLNAGLKSAERRVRHFCRSRHASLKAAERRIRHFCRSRWPRWDHGAP
jgi:glycosyltransferase involved in cell wall biosynthesis